MAFQRKNTQTQTHTHRPIYNEYKRDNMHCTRVHIRLSRFSGFLSVAHSDASARKYVCVPCVLVFFFIFFLSVSHSLCSRLRALLCAVHDVCVCATIFCACTICRVCTIHWRTIVHTSTHMCEEQKHVGAAITSSRALATQTHTRSRVKKKYFWKPKQIRQTANDS